MTAIIISETITYGCQRNTVGKVFDWTASGHEDVQVVDFPFNPEISNKVNAIKHMKPLFQFGNSVRILISHHVEIIPSL